MSLLAVFIPMLEYVGENTAGFQTVLIKQIP